MAILLIGNCTYWWLKLIPTFHSWNKPNLIMMHYSFYINVLIFCLVFFNDFLDQDKGSIRNHIRWLVTHNFWHSFSSLSFDYPFIAKTADILFDRMPLSLTGTLLPANCYVGVCILIWRKEKNYWSIWL